MNAIFYFGGQKFCLACLCSYILWVRMPVLRKIDTEALNDILYYESCSYPEVHEEEHKLTQLYKQKFRSKWSLTVCLHFIPDVFPCACCHHDSNTSSNCWGISWWHEFLLTLFDLFNHVSREVWHIVERSTGYY